MAQQTINNGASGATVRSALNANFTELYTASDAAAPKASPALTGTPTAPTASGGTSTTQIATTAFVASSIQPYRDYDSIAALEAATIPAEVKTVRLLGAYAPGDAGPPMICVRGDGPPADAGWRPGPVHYGYKRSQDRFKVDGTTSSTLGGYWYYASKSQPIYIEWFGGKADFWISTDSYGGGFVNGSPTDNSYAFCRAANWIGTDEAYGPTIQLGFGCYWFVNGPIGKEDTDPEYAITRAICVQGQGIAYNGSNSQMIFAAGKPGIYISSTNAGDSGSSFSTLRNFEMRSLGYGGNDDAHGIDAKATPTIEHVTVRGFGGHNIKLLGDVSGGNGNVDCFYINHCTIEDAQWDGIYIQGGDANAGVTSCCQFTGNGRWALNDDSFLKNHHNGHHTATNGTVFPAYGGPFRLVGNGAPATLIGCYSEGDQSYSEVDGYHSIVAGLHAAGIRVKGGALLQNGSLFEGGLTVSPPFDASLTSITTNPDNGYDHIRTTFRGFPNVITTFSDQTFGNDATEFHLFHKPNLGWTMHYGNAALLGTDYSEVLTPQGGTWYRFPQIEPNNKLFPKGFYYGGNDGVSSSGDPNTNRRLWVHNDPIADYAYQEHRIGDLAVATDGKSLGRLCTTKGVVTFLWATGSTWWLDAIVRNSAGRVYRLTRRPYNPDAWSMPAATVRATHTSGAVAYPEPNPLPSGGTIPGYTWTPVNEASHPTIDFTDRTIVPHWDDYPNLYPFGSGLGQTAQGIGLGVGAGEGGTWLRNPTNGVTYSCNAIPTDPANVYDQTWVMPNSTTEPTHTSGTQEYLEPNPDDEGPEPDTIPGYVWQYLHSDVSPAYQRVGQVFGSVATTIDVPSLASMALSSEVTVSLPGSQMGDDVTVACYTDSQGIQAVGARISTAGTGTWRWLNATPATLDLASTNWAITWRRPSS